MKTVLKKCPCGSGQWPTPNYDARGIFMFYGCIRCESRKLAGYRKDILTNSNYDSDEPIEEE